MNLSVFFDSLRMCGDVRCMKQSKEMPVIVVETTIRNYDNCFY